MSEATPTRSVVETFNPSAAALRRTVFHALLAHGTMTRATIAELTGLSRITASGVVDQLIEQGFVVRSGALASTAGGPSARAYALANDSAFAVGISIDGYRITVMTANICGDIVSRHEEPICDDAAVAEAVDRAVRNEFGKLAQPLAKLTHVVIGASGVADPDAHELAFAVNNPSWKSPLASHLRESLGCPVSFENDVNLATLAEHRFGAGARAQTAGKPDDVRDLVLIWLDEGIACGVILDGRLYRGQAGWAGEIAFLPMPVAGGADFAPGEEPTRTTTQRSIGTRGLAALAEEHGLDVDEVLRHTTLPAPASTADEPDPVAVARLELVRRIARAVAGPVFLFDPDIVVLAGRTARIGGEPLLRQVHDALSLLGPAPARLVLGETGADAIVAGAMLHALVQARDELFDERSP
jgi:predicted NBD/HSP70 family sugar kinase